MSNKIKDLDLDFLEGLPLALGLGKEDAVLPEPSLVKYYDNLRNRVMYIENELVREYLIEFTKMVIAWNKEDKNVPVEKRKPIKIMIYSYGGEIDSVQHFIDICLLSKTPIWTYNLGVAMSGGFYILLAGSKRFALKNSQALLHEGSGGTNGTAEQVRNQQAQYTKQLKTLAEYTLERTKITKEVYSRKKKSEWYINGEEQVSYGIVDKIITDIDDLT